MRNRRLHANANQTVGVIHRFPRMNRQLTAAVIGIAVIANIELGAVIEQNLNDLRASLVSSAMQCGAAGVGLGVDVKAQVDQQFDGF